VDSSFALYVYEHVIADHEEWDGELTVDDVATAEDALSIDELELTEDDLDTMAGMFRQACESAGIAPDFTGYEGY